MYDFRTDMADERNEIYKNLNHLDKEISGIEAKNEKVDNLEITTVDITNKEGEEALGKPVGRYVTIDIDGLLAMEDENIENTSKVVSKQIKKVVDKNVKKDDEILVIGLGNQYVTPDALGSKVVKDIEVTRHLIKYAPDCVVPGTRAVSSIAPGVLGTTGIETFEIIKGIVNNTSPKLIIAVDSLASKSIKRISSSIQISDTGIIPGSGVGNTRKELSKNTLGVPVIAIGVPMVVDLATITEECFNIFFRRVEIESTSNLGLRSVKNHINYDTIKKSLVPDNFNMIVTPKEIDELVEIMERVIASSINMAI